MNSEWLGSTSDRFSNGLAALGSVAAGLGQPHRLQQIRTALCVLAVVWLAWALSQMLWLLLPTPEAQAPPTQLINALSGSERGGARTAVNVEEMAGWELFGSLESEPVPVEAETARPAVPAGIEDGAQETRLALRLQGLVASPVEELARAIIEHKNKQEQYAVGDKLPVPGNVKLAKVLPDRVVLNNNGKYELLMLFDDSVASNAPLQPVQEEAPAEAVARRIDQRGSKDVTEMAQSYRQRLYQDPTSLAQAVRISAMREDGQLKGYRVSPGRDKKQFEALGFQPNDVVTGVNGIALTDPGKAMELYKVMRNAQEASFSVLREGQEITLVVGLESVADSE